MNCIKKAERKEAVPKFDAPLIEVKNLKKTYSFEKASSGGSFNILGVRQMGEQFDALKNISFELKQGESLGIIGPNGAGKSTLLRILGGVIEPSDGEVIVRGKVHALFELSSGFSPYLSGRENVFQKAAMMGLSEREIHARFDEILGFSGIEEFIDQPLHTYSMGMQARLAFAVATSIDADIFLIDEILSVGDEYFQGQCRRRIHEILGRGKSAIVVTHALDAYLRMCNRGIYLEKGAVMATGDPLIVAEQYISTFPNYNAPRPTGITISRVEQIHESTGIRVLVYYQAFENIQDLVVTVLLEKIDPLIGWETCFRVTSENVKMENIRKGETGVVEMQLINVRIVGRGRYYVSAALHSVSNNLNNLNSFYDSFSWTMKDFNSYMDIESGESAIFDVPARWQNIPVLTKGKRDAK